VVKGAPYSGERVKKYERSLLHHRVIGLFRVMREWRQFSQRSFSAPSPTLLKMKTLILFSNKDGKWVETGTYMGGTTEFLARRFPAVTSIEPSLTFHNYAKSRLRKTKNVILLHGTSEDLFETALLSAAPAANIWLDGHFSDGGTFLGSKVSPVEEELAAIRQNMDKFKSLTIFIDDVRLFPRSHEEETGYPKFQWVIDWCSQNGFKWQVQNDILIAQMIR
jgi:hypothetical protein